MDIIKDMLAELNKIPRRKLDPNPNAKENDSDRITDLEDAIMIISEMMFATESEGE